MGNEIFDLELICYMDDNDKPHYVYTLFNLTELFGVTWKDDEYNKGSEYFIENRPDVCMAVDKIYSILSDANTSLYYYCNHVTDLMIHESKGDIFTSYRLEHPEEFDDIYSGYLHHDDDLKSILGFINIKESLMYIFKKGITIDELRTGIASYNLIGIIEDEAKRNHQFMSYITALMESCLNEYRETGNGLCLTRDNHCPLTI